MKQRNFLLLMLAGVAAWLWQRNRRHSYATSMKNKVVIVTGASSGIGKATAEAFAAEGAHLVLVARRANVLAEIQQELQLPGRRIMTISADLTQEDDITRVVQETLHEFARIDVLVNSAGLTLGGYFEEQDPALIRKMIELNLYGTIRLTQEVIPVMKRQHSGHIVNLSSVAGLIHSPGETTYTATKAGLNAFSDALRRELYDDNVQVSIIMPGWTDTPMIDPSHLGKFPGYREGFIRLQSAEFVAKHIVNAVRYNIQRVRLGGIGFGMVGMAERLSHSSVDLWMTRIWNQETMIEAIHKTEMGDRSTARTGEPQA